MSISALLRRALVTLLSLLFFVTPVVAAAGAQMPICDGEEATIYRQQTGGTVRGTPEDDVIMVDGGDVTILGLAGDDRICQQEDSEYFGFNTVNGGKGNDRIFTGWGRDTVKGGPGNDFIETGPSGDIVDGGPGNDELNGGGGENVARFQGVGDVRVNLAEGIARTEKGTDGLNNFVGAWGGPGDDVLHGTPNKDRMNGGGGDDLVVGGRGNDSLQGGNGDDVIKGGKGVDQVNGGRGRDIVRGGDQIDVLKFNGPFPFEPTMRRDDPVRVNLYFGTARFRSARWKLSDVENIRFAFDSSTGDHILIGDAGPNRIHSDAGADRLFGYGGNDELYGGSGHDRLNGGNGTDGCSGDKLEDCEKAYSWPS